MFVVRIAYLQHQTDLLIIIIILLACVVSWEKGYFFPSVAFMPEIGGFGLGRKMIEVLPSTI